MIDFQTLLGNRYGYQPLPVLITVEDVVKITPYLKKDDFELLKIWYKRDENAIPPQFVLQVYDM